MTKPVNPRPSNRTHCSVTITTEADGLSESVDLTGLTLTAIQMSTAWTDAAIGFQASIDASTNYYPVYNAAGDHLTYPTSANRVITVGGDSFLGIQRLRVVSETTAGVAVAQAAEREIILSLADSVRSH